MLQFACSPLLTRADFYAFNCSCGLDSTDSTDNALVDRLIDMGSDMISILSGGRIYGRCVKTVRPRSDGGCLPVDNYWQSSYDEFGGLDVIPLRGPQTDIISVYIDGVALPSSAYRLINDRYLLRVDGGQWPMSNDLKLAATASGTWAITYRFGYVPDKIASDAVAELVCELAKDAVGRKSNLPLGLQSANIQGASVSMTDAAEALRDGHENLQAIARFLGIFNPDDHRAIIGVWSPEMGRGWELFESEGGSGS